MDGLVLVQAPYRRSSKTSVYEALEKIEDPSMEPFAQKSQSLGETEFQAIIALCLGLFVDEQGGGPEPRFRSPRHPGHTLQALHRALKPEGRVVLVEFREEDPDVPLNPGHKMSKAQINKELKANGFVLDEEFDELPWQHVMFFKRDSDVR